MFCPASRHCAAGSRNMTGGGTGVIESGTCRERVIRSSETGVTATIASAASFWLASYLCHSCCHASAMHLSTNHSFSDSVHAARCSVGTPVHAVCALCLPYTQYCAAVAGPCSCGQCRETHVVHSVLVTTCALHVYAEVTVIRLPVKATAALCRSLSVGFRSRQYLYVTTVLFAVVEGALTLVVV